MQARTALIACASFALTLLAAPVFAQAQNGKLIDFRMTTTVQMQGMAMPSRTVSRKVCTASGKLDPQALMHQGGDCKISNYRENGSTISFHVACSQPQAVSSDGVFHQHADGGIDGSMHSTMTAAGHPMTMDTAYVGQPAGSCAYKPAG